MLILLTPCLSVCVADVGAFFEAGTVLRYNFMSELSAASSRETNLTREELSFSFSTSSVPSILVYISSRTQDYLAVVLRQNGEEGRGLYRAWPIGCGL